MLGKLARWLRILGLDTLYEPSLSDAELLQRAKGEGRTLITRDVALHKRACREGAMSFLVREKDNLALLKEVAPLIDSHRLGSRCPACNTALMPAHTDERRMQSDGLENGSWRCPSCGKLYWHGSHWKGIRRTLILAGLGDPIGYS